MDIDKILIALFTLVYKEVKRFMRIWVQTLIPPAITVALYFVIFGNLIGPRVGLMSGISYMDYIVPGLIMMSVITNAYANVVSSFFGAKFQKHVEEMIMSPMPNWVILLGYIMGGVTRGLLVGTTVTILSLFFTELKIAHLGIAMSTIVLTAVLFSISGFINGVFANKFDDISIVPTFVLTPLTYLGGVFYSLDLLPEFWQKVSMLNPIVYMISAFRYGFLGVAEVPLMTSFLTIIGFIIVLGAWSLWLLEKGKGIRS